MQIAILLEAWCKTAPCEVYPDALDSFAGMNSSWHHLALSADWGWALRQTTAGTQAYILFNARLINELISAKKSVLSIKQSLLSMTGKAQRTRPGCFFIIGWIFFWWMNGQFRLGWANPVLQDRIRAGFSILQADNAFSCWTLLPVNAFSAWLNTKPGFNAALVFVHSWLQQYETQTQLLLQLLLLVFSSIYMHIICLDSYKID